MLKLIVVGKIKNHSISALCADYEGRLRHFGGIDIVEIKDSDPQREGGK